jgi:fucose 4-O-acetylase-like acetyltransferase
MDHTLKIELRDRFRANIDSIDHLRFLGILLVVLKHSFSPYIQNEWAISKYYVSNIILTDIGIYISEFSMPLFVFISGFIYAYLRLYLKKYPTFKILLVKKTKRLLVPYLILAPLYVYFFVDYNSVGEFFYFLIDYPGHFWFLIMLYLVFIAFYLAEEYFKTHTLKSLIIITLIFFCYPYFSYMYFEPIANLLKFLPFFFTGYVFYQKNHIIDAFLKNKFWVILLIHTILFVEYILFSYFNTGYLFSKINHYFTLLPMGILSICLVYIIFSQVVGQKSKKRSKIIDTVNKNSYYIYIFHQPLLMLFFKNEFIRHSHPIFVILSGFLMSVCVSLLLSEIFMNFKIGRVIIGAN